MSGASAMVLFGGAQRGDAIVEVLDENVAGIAFMEASRRASVSAGLGAQLP